MTKNNQFIFSGALGHPNIFRLRLFRAFSDAKVAQNKFLTELISPISAAHFSLLIDVVYNGENRLPLNFFIFEK